MFVCLVSYFSQNWWLIIPNPKARDNLCDNVKTCAYDGSNTRDKKARKLTPEGVEYEPQLFSKQSRTCCGFLTMTINEVKNLVADSDHFHKLKIAKQDINEQADCLSALV